MIAIIDFILFLLTVIVMSYSMGYIWRYTDGFTNAEHMKFYKELSESSSFINGNSSWASQLAYLVIGFMFFGYFEMWYCLSLQIVTPFLIMGLMFFLSYRISKFDAGETIEGTGVTG